MQWEWNVPNVASGAVARYEEHPAFPLFDVISSILLERHQTLMTVTEYTGHQRSVAVTIRGMVAADTEAAVPPA
jgi:hypothetical protein